MVLIKMTRDIIYQFTKYHYDKYIKEKDIEIIPEKDLERVIESMWTKERKNELATIIRRILKEKLKEEYSPMAVENLIFEIYADDGASKERMRAEILNHQRNLRK